MSSFCDRIRSDLFTVFAVGVLVASVWVDSAARQGTPPLTWGANALSAVTEARALPVLELAPVNSAQQLADDAARSTSAPLRYATPVPVQISLSAQDGTAAGLWETLPGGGRLWRQRISCPGATDLNLGFTRYRMPEGGTLHVYDQTDGYFEGPYTAQDNEEHGQLWVPVIPGDQAVIEVFIPPDAQAEPDIVLTQVGCGYRGLFFAPPEGQQKSMPKQGSCNIDVICPQGDPWRDEIRSVGTYSLGGSTLCTGTLVRDAAATFRPFFLSAGHCGITSGNAPSMVVYWNFESPTCGALSGGSLSQNQTGSIFRASKVDVDMALVELDDDPNPSFNVHFAGWDRSGFAPVGSVGIHHPSTDEKAISFNNQLLTSVNNCIGGGGSNTHWEVDDWEQGTTEPGSSGSGIWDPLTQRLVGFLSGGTASCSNPSGSDCYGKFSVAWDSGSSASSRLSDWLDPSGTGPTGVDGLDPGATGATGGLRLSIAPIR